MGEKERSCEVGSAGGGGSSIRKSRVESIYGLFLYIKKKSKVKGFFD
jgi:hypothetical protein